ncbi:MAG: MOSC domain-containing protein [Planctomycetes bacterium]|nr:MOSC domain-containing protein [Planctomycetota bacterium]
MRVLSVNTARPRLLVHSGHSYTTAINKQPVDGPVAVSHEHVGDDRQADRENHGGPHMAICVYPREHYGPVGDFLGVALDVPSFGENFTTEGLDETVISIGDTLSVGSAAVQVTKPRQPCSKLARKHDRPDLLPYIHETGYTGFYLRVLTPGSVRAGDAITLVHRPHPELTVAATMRAMFNADTDPAFYEKLVACEELAPDWRGRFARKL